MSSDAEILAFIKAEGVQDDLEAAAILRVAKRRAGK